jgi:hypothetical protein
MASAARALNPARIAYFVAAIVLAALPVLTDAASNKELRHLKGTVGYQPSTDAPLSPVVGSYVLPDDAYAVTQAKSAALLTLPDSSIVSFGENTRVQVGAFNETAAGPGSTITVEGGALRFDIKRPTGGAANYHFVTPTSQIGVRGTIGLLSLLNGQTTVACLSCAADSITVLVSGQTFALASGQAITVTATGAVTTSAVTSATLSGFSSAGVSTSATSGVAGATAGVGGAAAGVAPAAAAAAGAAAAGAAAGAVSASNASAKATPNPQLSGNLTINAARPALPSSAGPARRPQ